MIIGVALLAVLAFLLLSRRDKLAPPEQAVRERINAGVIAAEQKKMPELTDLVSERFRGMGMDRRQVKAMLFMFLQRGAWRKVFIQNLDIKVLDPKRVEASFSAVLAAGRNVNSIADIAPDSAGVFSFELTFELEDDDVWRVTTGTYQRRRLRDLL